MKRVGFILKSDSAEAVELFEQLAAWLHGRGMVAVVSEADGVAPPAAEVVAEKDLASDTDIAVVLGGDGTMLRAAGLVADQGIPVLGVNLGRLGFLTPFDPADARGAIVAALSGRLPRVERARLMVSHHAAGGGAITRAALNDAVIHQGGAARLIELEARLDGRLIGIYPVDGLIVCTPSGSTAYNLAAGGPILAPSQAAMVLTPICGHALTHRPLVVPHTATISITLASTRNNAVLTVDGQGMRPLGPGDRVDIKATARPLRTFQSDKDYFDILRDKLHWGARSQR